MPRHQQRKGFKPHYTIAQTVSCKCSHAISQQDGKKNARTCGAPEEERTGIHQRCKNCTEFGPETANQGIAAFGFKPVRVLDHIRTHLLRDIAFGNSTCNEAVHLNRLQQELDAVAAGARDIEATTQKESGLRVACRCCGCGAVVLVKENSKLVVECAVCACGPNKRVFVCEDGSVMLWCENCDDCE